MISLLQRKLVIKDMEEKKLLSRPHYADLAETIVKEKFYEAQRKRMSC
jgi:hypothetical protein